jgi:uncharacterized membrane protein (DUF485 family)
MDEMPVESRQKPPARQKVHRLGMVLFVAYEALSWRPVAGVNLAILSGLGLIVAAIILAVIFMLAGTTEDDHAA